MKAKVSNCSFYIISCDWTLSFIESDSEGMLQILWHCRAWLQHSFFFKSQVNLICEISHQLLCKLENHPSMEIKYVVLANQVKKQECGSSSSLHRRHFEMCYNCRLKEVINTKLERAAILLSIAVF